MTPLPSDRLVRAHLAREWLALERADRFVEAGALAKRRADVFDAARTMEDIEQWAAKP